ncbi:MAG: histidinol-phosphate transaminase [Chromatiales bacterium]|jgi:histidinol-phosphate aminotransferase|nr:histidinol-phosphate transaminase [Chromatiales bacterium]
MNTSSRDARTDDRIADWVRPQIRALRAYHVQLAAGLIKLDAMENPYAWPPEVVDEWSATLREVSLNRYPDPAPQALMASLREFAGVPTDAALMLGNGSDELIQLIMLALAVPGRKVLAADPAFSMYRMISLFVGLEFIGVPLRADFDLDIEAMLAAIAEHRPAMVLIDRPNNPSGRLFAAADVRRVIEAAPGLVVVDEAYQPFSGETVMPWLREYPHLLILRTLSKMGLAGLRLGLLVGNPAWMAELDKIRLPYNINVLTQASARFALGHSKMLEEQAARIRADREYLYQSMAAMPGLKVQPSRANFILFRTPAGQGERIFAGLLARRVLIKNLAGAGLPDCLRVTVGTPEENLAFLAALAAVLQE